MSTTITLSAAVLFGLMGVAALVKPTFIAGLFSVKTLPSPMRSEVRAVYGGYGLAVAAALLLAFQGGVYAPGIILLVAMSLLGMAAGRVVALAVDRTIDPWPGVFLVVEIALGLALLWAL